MDIKKYTTPDILSYVALTLSAVAVLLVGFIALNLDTYVDAGVRDAVLVTKIRLAELEAAAGLANAKTAYVQKTDQNLFKETVSRIASDLSAVYSQAPDSEQEKWLSLKQQFDDVLKAIESKDKELVQKVDALVVRLRTER